MKFTLSTICCFLLFFSQLTGQTTDKYGSGSNAILDFYQHVISPAKGTQNCSMHPSCSQYAKQSFQNYSLPKAYLLTTDRLLRCGHDLNMYPTVELEDNQLYSDPVPGLIKTDYNYLFHDDSLMAFSDSLFQMKFYETALLGYQYQYFFEGNQLRKERLLLKIASIYYHTENYENLNSLYNAGIFKKWNQSVIFDSLTLLESQGLYKRGQFKNSISLLNTVESPMLKDHVNYLKGMCFIRQENWKLAEGEMKKIAPASCYYNTAQNYTNIELEIESVKQRKAWLAATTSAVIPGSGYFIAGKKQTALVAMVLNGLFIWTSYEAFNKNHNALGTTVSLLGMGWYFGSIKGSFNAVRDYNKKQINHYLDSKPTIKF